MTEPEKYEPGDKVEFRSLLTSQWTPGVILDGRPEDLRDPDLDTEVIGVKRADDAGMEWVSPGRVRRA